MHQIYLIRESKRDQESHESQGLNPKLIPVSSGSLQIEAIVFNFHNIDIKESSNSSHGVDEFLIVDVSFIKC